MTHSAIASQTAMIEPRTALPKGNWNHMAKLDQIAKMITNNTKTNLPRKRTGFDFKIEDMDIPYSPDASFTEVVAILT
ncbi:hypothetical protein Brsp01_48160 [Brucella sp. NBRC 12950]|nr:hypothetical protein Brsp01_48160 [Brucella sp. NBRC 12950]